MKRSILFAAALPVLVGACGGGGGGGGGPAGTVPGVNATGTISGTSATPTPAPTGATIVIGLPTASPSPPVSVVMSGTVIQIPVDAYGPVMMNGVTYASSDAAQTTPLANATIVIGPSPIAGASPPGTLPAGDVLTTTNANGAFSATLTVAPIAPSPAEPFVIPQNDILAFAPPAAGYYVHVFGRSTDGKSAGTSLPLHRFVSAAAATLALRVSTVSAAEASALAVTNADRATFGAGALTFDESAEEIARLHAADEATANYTCHYDTHNIGPSSRYLAAGGIGLTGENLALTYGPDVTSAVQAAENAYLAERANVPQGGHFLNLADATHLWAGIGVAPYASAPGFYEIDDEFVTPTGQSSVVGPYGYGADASCSPGISVNNS